jgi:Ca2+-binding EF-hand superfamily protein
MEMLLETYDANGDGGVTQEEIDSVRAARLSEFDTDQDSQLNLEEYQALWLDAMRERMVDQFQRHDDDGDGVVTAEEFGQDLANIVDRRDRNDDGVLNADDGNARPQPPADTE